MTFVFLHKSLFALMVLRYLNTMSAKALLFISSHLVVIYLLVKQPDIVFYYIHNILHNIKV